MNKKEITKMTHKTSTGHYSTGYYSTGRCSTGDYSTGDYSTGRCSTGDWSTGDYSTGDWSISDCSTGHFSTIDYSGFGAFNKPCTPDEWDEANKPNFLYFDLIEWMDEAEMTDQEKEDNPTYKKTGGYLKVYDYQEAFQNAYNNAPQEEKDMLLKLPNFDADVFQRISGIDVRKDTQSCAGKIVEIDGKKYKLQEV